MPSTDPVSSINNCYQYRLKCPILTQYTASSSRNAQLSQLDLVFPTLSHSSILKTNLIKRSLCLTATYWLKTFDYDCIKEYRCILGVSNIQFKSKLNFGALAGRDGGVAEGWRYFKCFKSNSCGLKFERIVSIHTYLNFI